ncbi:hypothetical protein BJY01DRAFT_108548 [Aspergillus pseudoustus]|uniref:Uncharacterized protein n=1 Tax=Aspergillus pseudoustus TaxID=1810923 RepID=A0ABR4IUL3_9EURO
MDIPRDRPGNSPIPGTESLAPERTPCCRTSMRDGRSPTSQGNPLSTSVHCLFPSHELLDSRARGLEYPTLAPGRIGQALTFARLASIHPGGVELGIPNVTGSASPWWPSDVARAELAGGIRGSGGEHDRNESDSDHFLGCTAILIAQTRPVEGGHSRLWSDGKGAWGDTAASFPHDWLYTGAGCGIRERADSSALPVSCLACICLHKIHSSFAAVAGQTAEPAAVAEGGNQPSRAKHTSVSWVAEGFCSTLQVSGVCNHQRFSNSRRQNGSKRREGRVRGMAKLSISLCRPGRSSQRITGIQGSRGFGWRSAHDVLPFSGCPGDADRGQSAYGGCT